MKFVMYGIRSCHSCKDAEEAFAKAGISYEYKDFAEDAIYLKEFILHRDHDAAFDSIKANDYIGIPYFEMEDGTISFDFEEVIAKCR